MSFRLATLALLGSVIATPAMAITYLQVEPDNGSDAVNQEPAQYSPLFNDIYNFVTVNAQDGNPVSNSVKLNAKASQTSRARQFERRNLLNFRIPAGTHLIGMNDSPQQNAQFAGVLTLSNVPEPASWILTIVGIGMAGGALRWRRRNGTKLPSA